MQLFDLWVPDFWTVSKGVFLFVLALWSGVFLFQVNPFPRSILIGFVLVYLVGSRLLMIVLGKIIIAKVDARDAP